MVGKCSFGILSLLGSESNPLVDESFTKIYPADVIPDVIKKLGHEYFALVVFTNTSNLTIIESPTFKAPIPFNIAVSVTPS